MLDLQSLLLMTNSNFNIQQLIEDEQIGLVRHSMGQRSDGDWSDFDNILKFDNDMLMLFTSGQSREVFTKYKIILTFVKTQGRACIFRGAFTNVGKDQKPITQKEFLTKARNKKIYDRYVAYCNRQKIHEHVGHHYMLESNNILNEFNNRLVIDWGGSLQSWVQKKLNKKILEILPEGFVSRFPGWNEVLISHQELTALVLNPGGNRDWYRFLSQHDGVYVILDKKTNMKYVGSAYASNESGGLWGRLAGYVATGHNDNRALKELDGVDPRNRDNFMYSLHYVVPKGPLTKKIVLFHEQLLKKKIGAELNCN